MSTKVGTITNNLEWTRRKSNRGIEISNESMRELELLNENLREENDRVFGEEKLADFAKSWVTRMVKPQRIEIRRFNWVAKM